MGQKERTFTDWVLAAEVAAKLRDQSLSLLDYTICLTIIHRCPEEDWADLVKRMLAGQWTQDQTLIQPALFPELRHECRYPLRP